jgi:hypothetical protein
MDGGGDISSIGFDGATIESNDGVLLHPGIAEEQLNETMVLSHGGKMKRSEAAEPGANILTLLRENIIQSLVLLGKHMRHSDGKPSI